MLPAPPPRVSRLPGAHARFLTLSSLPILLLNVSKLYTAISLFFSSLITRYIYIFFSLSLYESSSNHRCYCGAGSHRAPSTSNSWHDAQHATAPSPPFDMSTTPLSTFLLVVPPWSIRFSLLLLLARGWRRVSRSRQPRKTYLFEVDGNGRGRDGLSAREQCHCASPRRSASDGTLHTKGIGQPIIFRTVFRAFDSCTTLAPFLETFGIFCSSKNSADRKLAGCVPNAIRASTTRPGRQKATVKIVFEGNTPRVLFLFDGVVESGRFLL